jgi:hypothetical protein
VLVEAIDMAGTWVKKINQKKITVKITTALMHQKIISPQVFVREPYGRVELGIHPVSCVIIVFPLYIVVV